MNDVRWNPAQAFVLDLDHNGAERSILIIKATCSWCNYPDTQCAAILERNGGVLKVDGVDRPAFSVVAALCDKCFREYWLGGGNERVIR